MFGVFFYDTRAKAMHFIILIKNFKISESCVIFRVGGCRERVGVIMILLMWEKEKVCVE